MLTKHALHFQFKIGNAKKRIPTIYTVCVTEIDISKYYNCNLCRYCSDLKCLQCVWPVLLLTGDKFSLTAYFIAFCFASFFAKKLHLIERKKFQKKVLISSNFYGASGLPLG
jgi:hypothetical protein